MVIAMGWFSKKSEPPKEKVEPTVEIEVKSQVIGANDLYKYFGNGGSLSESVAMRIEAYYSAIRDKAESIGQIPLKLYRQRGDETRQEVKQGRNHTLFTKRPNDFMSWQTFQEMMVLTLERQGAFYAYPAFNDRGSLMELIPFFHQGSVTVQHDIDGQVYYQYVTNDNRTVVARPEQVFVVKGMTSDGYTPLNPIYQCATLLGIANSQEKGYKELQDEGITAQMALATDNVFKDQNGSVQRLKDDWKKFRGPGGHKEIPILEQGLKPVSLRLTPKETELLSHREFSVERICRMVRVPLYRVGMAPNGGMAKGLIPEQEQMYMSQSLGPILKKAEDELNRFTPDGHFVEFFRMAFYRGNPMLITEAVDKAIKSGVMSIQQGQETMGFDATPGDPIYAIDTNNATYGRWEDIERIQDRLYSQGNSEQVSNTNDSIDED